MAFTPKLNKEQALAMVKGGMPPAKVAEAFGVVPSAVSQLLKRTRDNEPLLTQYRQDKDKVMETIQSELLAAVKADDPKSAQQLVTSAAILDDKIRLERGQVQSIHALDIRAIIASLPTDL